MATQTFNAELQHSVVIWTGKKVTGTHTGTIDVSSGSFNVTDGKVESGEIEFDVDSMIITDITDPETNAQFKGHLLSDDFFGAEQFPKAFYKIVNVVQEEGDRYIVNGSLTIKGITQAVSFPALITVTADRLSATGRVTVDRTVYGMRFRSGNFFQNLGDTLISNDFILDIKVNAKLN